MCRREKNKERIHSIDLTSAKRKMGITRTTKQQEEINLAHSHFPLSILRSIRKLKEKSLPPKQLMLQLVRQALMRK
jgi:hypothetical protein